MITLLLGSVVNSVHLASCPAPLRIAQGTPRGDDVTGRRVGGLRSGAEPSAGGARWCVAPLGGASAMLSRSKNVLLADNQAPDHLSGTLLGRGGKDIEKYQMYNFQQLKIVDTICSSHQYHHNKSFLDTLYTHLHVGNILVDIHILPVSEENLSIHFPGMHIPCHPHNNDQHCIAYKLPHHCKICRYKYNS